MQSYTPPPGTRARAQTHTHSHSLCNDSNLDQKYQIVSQYMHIKKGEFSEKLKSIQVPLDLCEFHS